MRKALIYVLLMLLIGMGLGLPVSAEAADYSTLPEQYVALEEYLPTELSEILPDGLFSHDPADVQAALAQMISFSGLIALLVDLVGVHLSESGTLLASICGLLLLCGLLRAFGASHNIAWASLAPRLCLFGAVAGAGYAAVSAMVEYFETLQVLMGGMLPVMSVMYVLGGNLTRATVGNAALGVGLNVCRIVCAGMAPPLFGACMALCMPTVMDAGIDLSRLSGFFKKTYTSVLGVLTLILSLCLSAQNLIASRADSVAMRSGRYAIGQMIPIVGGALGGSLDTLAASLGLLRGLAGTCGVLLLLLCCLPVLCRMLLLRLLFDLGSGAAQLMGCGPESAVLAEASSLFGYMAAAVAMCTAVFLIAVGAFASCAAAWVS